MRIIYAMGSIDSSTYKLNNRCCVSTAPPGNHGIRLLQGTHFGANTMARFLRPILLSASRSTT